MADKTKIEWTDATWNPITGCSVVSPGCTNCYAMRLAGTRLKHHPTREGLTVESKAGPVWNGEVRFNEKALMDPLRWSKPRMIFVCAHGDLFAEDVPEEWIDKVFAVMATARQHTFQVLTKRPERARNYLMKEGKLHQVHITANFLLAENSNGQPWRGPAEGLPKYKTKFGPSRYFPLPNLWLGVSVEDQKRADERVPLLMDTPAAKRFVSAEPLLGPVDLRYGLRLSDTNEPLFHIPPVDHLDWVIVGGESGPGARPMHPDWARSLRDQCAAANVPFFFKQWGEWCPATQDFGVSGHVMPDTGEMFRWIGWDGKQQNPSAHGLAAPVMAIAKMGKRAAGRLLDGVEHSAMPAIDRRAA